jgi:hypothetical protein
VLRLDFSVELLSGAESIDFLNLSMLRLTSGAIRVCHPKGSEKTEVFWLGVCRQDGAAGGKKGPAPAPGHACSAPGGSLE